MLVLLILRHILYIKQFELELYQKAYECNELFGVAKVNDRVLTLHIAVYPASLTLHFNLSAFVI